MGLDSRTVSTSAAPQTSAMVRNIAYGQSWNPAGIVILVLYLGALAAAGLWFVYRKQNL